MQQDTVHEQGTDGWHRERKKFAMTASEVPAAIDMNYYKDSRALMWEKVLDTPSTFKGNDATRWGHEWEGVARDHVMSMTGHACIPDPGVLSNPSVYGGRVGGSPDGITYCGILLEIKCPYSRSISRKCRCVENDDVNKDRGKCPRVHIPRQYMGQVAALLRITQLKQPAMYIEFAPPGYKKLARGPLVEDASVEHPVCQIVYFDPEKICVEMPHFDTTVQDWINHYDRCAYMHNNMQTIIAPSSLPPPDPENALFEWLCVHGHKLGITNIVRLMCLNTELYEFLTTDARTDTDIWRRIAPDSVSPPSPKKEGKNEGSKNIGSKNNTKFKWYPAVMRNHIGTLFRK